MLSRNSIQPPSCLRCTVLRKERLSSQNLLLFTCIVEMPQYLNVCGTQHHALLAQVVQTLDSAIHRINHYPADKYYGNQLCYPLDSDLSAGQRYPTFEQQGPVRHAINHSRPQSPSFLGHVVGNNNVECKEKSSQTFTSPFSLKVQSCSLTCYIFNFIRRGDTKKR